MLLAPEFSSHGEPNPLLGLLRRCVVAVHGDGELFRGTGFFVAPGEILTCAHVVHAQTEISVVWEEGNWQAAVTVCLPALDLGDARAAFYPLPDVALLRLADSPATHPCVGLDLTEPAAGPSPDLLRLDAFTVGGHAPYVVGHSGASLAYEGPFEEQGWRLMKLRGGQVVGGFSGGPLLNLRSSGVCGLVDSSRNERSDLGGFGIPLSCFLEQLPGLEDRNAAHHRQDRSWSAAVVDEREQAARRSGARQRLPLVEPVARLVWAVGDPPSDLLRARYAVVPLVGRDELLAELMLWRESDRPLGVAVLVGAGGMGKTRAALEVCLQAGRAGWTAGVLSIPDRERQSEALDALAAWPGRLAVAVDYAETRPDLVASLLLRLLRRSVQTPPARVVLVVRQALTRRQLEEAFAAADAWEELAGVLREAEVIRLDRIDQPVDRTELFEQALRAFSSRLGTRRKTTPTPELRADHFARPLFVLLAALLRTEDPSHDVDTLGDQELLAEVTDHREAHYWERWNGKLQTGLDRADQRLLVALASLLGATTEKEAFALVRLSPSFADASAERVRAVARWLGHLYSSGGRDAPAVAPLEPDLLAEALVASELSLWPELVGAALDAASDRQLPRALLLLSRAAASRADLAEQASEALNERLSRIIRRIAADPFGGEELLSILSALLHFLPHGDKRWLEIADAMTKGGERVFRGGLEAWMAIDALRAIDLVLVDSPDPARRAAVQFRLASFLVWGIGDLEEGEASCRQALALYEEAGDRAMALLAATELAHIRGLRGDIAGQEEQASAIAAAAEQAGERFALMQALGAAGEADIFLGRFEAASSAWRRTIAIAEKAGKPHRVTFATSFLACSLALSGRVKEAIPMIQQAKSVDSGYQGNMLVESETLVRWLAGDFPAAVATAEEVTDQAARGISRRRAWSLSFGALAAAERSLDAEAKRYLHLGMATYAGRPWSWFTDAFTWVQGVLAWRDSRRQEAHCLIERSALRMLEMSARPWAAFVLVDLAELACEDHDVDLAQRAAEGLEEVASFIGPGPYRALAAMAAGWWNLASGASSLAAERAEEAAVLLAPTGLRAFWARALDLRARALRETDRRGAIESFKEAAGTFQTCGSTWRLERTVDVLRELN